MSRNDRSITDTDAPKAIGPYSQAVRPATSCTCRARSRSTRRPASSSRATSRPRRGACSTNLRRSPRPRAASLAHVVQASTSTSPTSVTSRSSTSHGGVLQRAVPGARHGRRCGAAARRRVEIDCMLHLSAVPAIERRPSRPAAGRRPARRRAGARRDASRSSASTPSQDLLFRCRCATRTARASCRSARCAPACAPWSKATIAARRGRVPRPALAARARISDGSGFLTLRFFHFSGAQQAAARARHAPALLRRSAPRPARARRSCIPNTGDAAAPDAAGRARTC